jgi:hypothetical protein
MARVHLILACCALLIAVGCRQKKTVESESGTQAVLAPRDGEAVGSTESDAGDKGPSDNPDPGSTQSADSAETDRVWVRSGERPTFSMIKNAYRAKHGKKIRIHAKPQELDGGRYFCLVSELLYEHEDDTDPWNDNLFALVVSENGGEAQLESRVELLVKKSELALAQDPEFEPYSADMELSIDKSTVGDLDADGHPEALVKTRYSVQERAHGLTYRTQYYIINVDPVAMVAFSVLTYVSTDESECEYSLYAHCKRKDVDGDTHPDIVVKEEEEAECMGVGDGEQYVTEYLWDKATDTWLEPASEPVE